MPGYDKNKFINLKDEDELMCGICHGIFIEPKVTPCCCQTYCADCIEQWLKVNSSCPNDRQPLYANNLFSAPRLVYNMLNKLLMKCEFDKNGCEESFLFENIESIKEHMKICSYNPNNICIDCDHIIGNRSSHNCVENLKSDNKKLNEEKYEVEHKLQLSLNSVNEKCETYLKQLNDLKEINSKNENQLKLITEDDKTLRLRNNELALENKKLRELSSKLYDHLKSIERDMAPLPTLNDSNLNNFLENLQKFVDRQSNCNTQANNIFDKLSKFASNIQNDVFFNQIYNETNVTDVADVPLINLDSTNDKYKARSEARFRSGQEEPSTSRVDANLVSGFDLAFNNVHKSDKTFPEVKLVFKIGHVSKSSGRIKSPPTVYKKLSWQIMAKTVLNYWKTKSMGVYLLCNDESNSTTWSCNARADIKLISQKPGIDDYSRTIEHKFSAQNKQFGFRNFIAGKDILDPVIGYIKDDAIILEVWLSADEPQGI